MECSNPPALTDEELSAVLDDEAEDSTLQHLRQCPGCAERLGEMKKRDKLLERLWRIECPVPQRLADYYLGMSDAETSQPIRQHLEDCPRCQDELMMLAEFLGLEEEPIANPIIELWPKETRWKAIRVETSGSLALKGTDDETAHDAKAGTATVYLESNATLSGFVLKGQVLDPQVDWAGAVAEAWAGGATQQVCILDADSEFRFDLTTAGSVNLYITSVSGVTLVVENITIQS